MNQPLTDRPLPAIIQGGMGVSVSNWRLARAVSLAGQLGVVSGTALERVVAYRLQDGDPDGGLRRVISRFPLPEMAQRVLAKWFVPGGLAKPGTYQAMPMYSHEPGQDLLELTVVANYAEVALAKEGHDGVVGINLLEKISLPNLASAFGAMLAGVDYVLMGAGIPREIPGCLDRLAAFEEATYRLPVVGALAGEEHKIRFDPKQVVGDARPPITRPRFLAIIASDTLGQSLIRNATGAIFGWVVEGPTAGGHNAPPRGNSGGLNDKGEPIYGPRDVVDLTRLKALGLPYWLAGGFATAEALAQAQANGAVGIQVGTAFAFCDESGLKPELKAKVLDSVRAGTAGVFTDPRASPTGFPFKVIGLEGTLSEEAVFQSRSRICNLGYLRHAYRTADGKVGWRCPAEPEAAFIAKGGDAAELVGRKCICNGLMASAGLGLALKGGGMELPILTAGDDVSGLGRFLIEGQAGYQAADVLAALLAPVAVAAS